MNILDIQKQKAYIESRLNTAEVLLDKAQELLKETGQEKTEVYSLIKNYLEAQSKNEVL